MDEKPAAVSPDPSLVSLESAATHDGSAGPALRLRHALAPGALLAGRYRIERFLARGGMGEVHQATDELLDVAIALKSLRLDLEGDPVRLKRFKRELLLARSITHPNVCRVYDLEVDRSAPPRPLRARPRLAATLAHQPVRHRGKRREGHSRRPA
jgi:hypothetical protein